MNRILKPLGLAVAIAAVLTGCPAKEDPAAVAAAPADAAPTVTATTPSISFSAADVDPSVDVCTDLNAHVNGKWLAANPVPGDRTTWGSFESLAERSLEIQHQLAEQLGARSDATGTAKLIGDVWATGMDEAAIEAAGIAPLSPILDEIASLDGAESIAGFLRSQYAKGNGYVFGFGAEADFADSSMNIAYATQAGLGLPDKGYYFDADKAAIREAYVAHIARILELSGSSAEEAAAQAQQVMAFETRLAEASNSSEELSRDIGLYYNPVSVADADAMTPNFPWSDFFASQGLEAPAKFSLAQPQFHQAVNAMLADVPVETWQAYLRFKTVDGAAPFLSSAFVQANFEFYGKTLNGQQELQARWKRVLNTINGQMGEALGQEYVRVAFSPEAKERMQQLVANLSAALKARLENLAWMSDETRAQALEKWAAFTPKIGYPDKWRDWSGLETSRTSYLANVIAANEFNYRWNIAKIGKPVDRSEWGMSPQTVNAYYNPLANEIVFPAAILQPPFFDVNADDALNYGGIGAVIGHEMMHGYDDQGARFNAAGNMVNWWTEADAAGFKERTGQLVRQFDEYRSIDDLPVNGNLTLGENIADLGGLAIAYDALQRELENKRVGEIDGYTPDQRFFLNWATVWRRNYAPENLRVRLVTDPHAPGNFRAIGAPSNMPQFAAAFGCEAGSAMVRDGESAVRIW
ncbi:M13 family metallopeptidase [Arenimonas composti]|uniref:Peptidase n=1 Tax=Arenimonas composti TR7-09 = DSM 18010 TaxID=1121013 RepID=A0A091BCI3_9GAMM|nr:M13-type metalloendopeptidase [Arenimonas composti]KFN49247.1 hypothetical protein P873_11825 [Arenimonas composti TR7-09 = DSM 18010]